MAGQVIQGFFIGGRMRPPVGRTPGTTAQRVAAPRAAGTPGAPAPAFAGRAGAVQARPAPGRPPLVHAPAGQIAQPHGGRESFEIDPALVGLARGGGSPLPQAVLSKMEAAFDTDFSGVRVHVGPQASRIGAVAFTTGNDLYFAPGRYQPDSIQGQQLIGHELAHVVQQRQGRVRPPTSGVSVVQDRALEAEADRLGMRAAAMVPVQRKAGPGTIQRAAAVRVSRANAAGNGSYHLSADVGGQRVGSVTVHLRGKASAEVTDLSVAAAHRDQGIGRMLLASAGQTGRQFGKATLSLAAEDNGSGRLKQWYKTMGFAPVGVDQRGHQRLEVPISRLMSGAARRSGE